MTERIIQEKLKSLFENYNYKLFNAYVYEWESDFFGISKSGYTTEVEIKISRADFKKDFQCKTYKHDLFKKSNTGVFLRKFHEHMCFPEGRYIDESGKVKYARGTMVDFINPADHLPNKFYYCVPEGLISVDDIPKYAGLMYVKKFDGGYGSPYEVKRAPFLHKQKNNLDRCLLDKFYYKTINLRRDMVFFLHDIQRLDPDKQNQAINEFINKIRL